MQSNIPPEAAVGVIAVAFVGIMIVLGLMLAISAVVCYFTSEMVKRIPAEHRKIEPNMVWLLMIPCFNLIWNFFVFPKVAASFKSYFDSQNITDVGDCAAQLSLIYCIVALTIFIPYIKVVGGPAALVLLILVLVKFNDLKNRIPLSA